MKVRGTVNGLTKIFGMSHKCIRWPELPFYRGCISSWRFRTNRGRSSGYDVSEAKSTELNFIFYMPGGFWQEALT